MPTFPGEAHGNNPPPLIARPGRAWFEAILRAVHTQLTDLQPVGLASVLMSLGELGVRPHRCVCVYVHVCIRVRARLSVCVSVCIVRVCVRACTYTQLLCILQASN